MSRKYVDLWVSRDSIYYCSDFVGLWDGDPGPAVMGVFDLGAETENYLTRFCLKEFAKVAGWTPRKGRKYPVTIEIKRKGK